ncbi:hypothetical protein QW180_01440 [Vibrio sinaloensis]|nr:hypothetical protein [Vibrio sinaloensis]
MVMTFTYVTSPWAEETTVTLNPTGRDIELVSLLKVSDSVLGEAMITITANNQVRLPKESTLALLKEFVSSSNLQRLSTNSQNTYLTAKDFTAAGLDLNFDMSTLECIIFLSLTMPAELDNYH